MFEKRILEILKILICFILLVCCIMPEACAADMTLSSEKIRQESIVHDSPKYSWDSFVNFTGLNLFDHTTQDEDLLCLADKISMGFLYVSDTLDGPRLPHESFDWNMQVTESPNTYQLYLQGLGPLQVLSKAYHLTENNTYLSNAIKLVESWRDYYCSPQAEDNPYVWNDHGAAIRAHSLVMLCLALEEQANYPEIAEGIGALLAEHADFLSDSAHYTANHNHGIMQDAALLEVAFYLRSTSVYANACDRWIETAKTRLVMQRESAFSSEMVHVENSIGYHAAVTELFVEIATFLEKMGDSSAIELTHSVDKAKEFLEWCTMPNGTYASFGDTIRGKKNIRAPKKADIIYGEAATCYYPASGYWFYRERKDDADATWKMFKAGYSSGTHKHADDCSFMLYGKGSPIFIDPGMYNYMIGNQYRDYLLTSSAHNTVTVDEKSYSPTKENSWKTGILACSATENMDYILAFNDMYPGTEIDRHFYSSGDLTIIFDDIVSSEEHKYSQLFHLSENVSITKCSPSETLITIGNSGYHVRIRQFIPSQQEIFCGREDSTPFYGHAGGNLNELVDIETICYQQLAESASFITIITLEDSKGNVQLKNGGQINYEQISVNADLTGCQIGEEQIEFKARTRFSPHSEASVEGTNLHLAFPSDLENCLYSFYLISANTLDPVFKGNYSQEKFITLDLSAFAGEDLLVRTYVKSNIYSQRKYAVTAALIWDQEHECFYLDDGTLYPYLNLEYVGHSYEMIDKNHYLFNIDYHCSLPVLQHWYIYRNGGYYMNTSSVNEHTLDFTFDEPGDYTVMYYLKSKLGENEFWNYNQIHIE